jgi:hypothetical protein
MSEQNFAATAKYFERRARKASSHCRQQQLQDAAAHYQAKAEDAGQSEAAHVHTMRASRDALTRRRRLIELFRAGAKVS